VITYYFRTIKDTELKVLPELRTGVWVHAVAPNEEEIAKLIKELSLDEDIISDASDFFEVPRLERSAGATYFFTRYPYTDQKEGSDTAPLLIVMGESFVLTLSLREVGPFKALHEGKTPVVTTQKGKLFIDLMDAITRSFDGELVRLRKAVQRDRVRLRKIGPREIERLVQYETKLNNMVDGLIPTNVWLQQVPAGNYMQLYTDDLETMADLVIANSQVVDSARSILKTIQNMRGGVEAIMSSRLNNSLSILTVLTILLTVPLVIFSLYGMNVELPFQHSPYAFLIILATNMVVLGLLVGLFKYKNWF
jgi:magnesium transporter